MFQWHLSIPQRRSLTYINFGDHRPPNPHQELAVKVLPMAILVFSENLCLYTFNTLQGWEILPKHSSWRSFMKFVDRSHVTSSNQRFFKFKILKKLTRKRSRRIGKMIGLAVLSYSMDDIRKMYGGVFLYSNPLGSYEQSKFSRLVAKLKIAHNFPMDLNREKPHRTSSLFHP